MKLSRIITQLNLREGQQFSLFRLFFVQFLANKYSKIQLQSRKAKLAADCYYAFFGLEEKKKKQKSKKESRGRKQNGVWSVGERVSFGIGWCRLFT
jgi:hypothetical protein